MRGLAIVCSKPQPDAEGNLVKRVATITQARAGRRQHALRCDGADSSWLYGALAAA